MAQHILDEFEHKIDELTIIPSRGGVFDCMGIYDLMAGIKERGTSAMIDFMEKKKGHPLEDTNGFLGFPKVKAWEEAYLPADQVQRKYKDSSGYEF